MEAVLADSGQTILKEDVDRIVAMAFDLFINEHSNLEYRYSNQEVCDHFDISKGELNRVKNSLRLHIEGMV